MPTRDTVSMEKHINLSNKNEFLKMNTEIARQVRKQASFLKWEFLIQGIVCHYPNCLFA